MAERGPWLEGAWRTRGVVSTLLLPLAAVYGAITALRRALFAWGVLATHRLPVPVVVVGNITVGGTGKTPLVISLIEALQKAGLKPGVISRGYRGRYADHAAWAEVLTSDAGRFGDEIVLVRERTGVPAAVGKQRAQACRGLLAAHPLLDVLVCDDGLQHYGLARDLEIAVFDERGIGNGRLLPAGPLRESLARLRSVDAVVGNGVGKAELAVLAAGARAQPPCFHMELQAIVAYQLVDPSRRTPLASFQGQRLAAAAGIGAPERFFATLRKAGLSFYSMALADHFDYATNPFAGRPEDTLLITEKDAVKCRQMHDPRLWVVPVEAILEHSLVTLVLEKIHARN